MFTVIVYSVFKVKYYEEFRVDLQAETVHNSLNLSKSLNYLKIIFKISLKSPNLNLTGKLSGVR